MKNFVLRLILTSLLLYALGAVAYALLHYPPGERPDVGGILGDYTKALGSVFSRAEPERSVPPAAPSPGPEAPRPGGLASLDDLRGDTHLSLGLSQVLVPDSGRLPASAARMWDELRPIHAQVLPQGIEELGRLRVLKSSDKPAFERDRAALRARLASARATLHPHTQSEPRLDAAVKLLDVLEQLDAKLAGL